MTQYGKIEYWEDRYQKDKEKFDWLQRIAPPSGNTVLRDLISELAMPNSQILIVGCGTSRMPEEMMDEGYFNITCIDYSYSAIRI